ncbi:hypothetical protein VNO80_17405 [Phaseolus coccineus]|uniref:Uncharacterized protein n=1 Tax=Phaseolus coccineus TaxID=3886 RepID=A0AAN9MCB9_PHACN
MRISDWMQDVNANTIYMKDSFDSERRSGGFIPFYLDLIALEGHVGVHIVYKSDEFIDREVVITKGNTDL